MEMGGGKMKSLWDVSSEYIQIMEQIEAEEGVLDEELERRLDINQQEFSEKAQSYVRLIKTLESQITQAKEEYSRITNYVKSKEKVIEKLESKLLDALKLFGSCEKTKDGEIYRAEIGTYRLSTRRSVAVDFVDPFSPHYNQNALVTGTPHGLPPEYVRVRLSLDNHRLYLQILDALKKTESELPCVKEPKKDEIKKTLSSGGEVVNSVLKTNYSLQIR